MKTTETKKENKMKIGEVIPFDGDIILNEGKKTITLTVTNAGKRPIQVGSHIHFFEVNNALEFDRKSAYGFRLNIAAGTAVRFEGGESKSVELVEIGGKRKVMGISGAVNGYLKR